MAETAGGDPRGRSYLTIEPPAAANGSGSGSSGEEPPASQQPHLHDESHTDDHHDVHALLHGHDHDKHAKMASTKDDFTDGVPERRFWCFPWPRPNQRVPYPPKWRKEDMHGKEDPFAYNGCGLWWWMWVFVGGDTKHFVADYNRPQALAARYGWTWPPLGRNRHWLPTDSSSAVLPPDLVYHHFDMQTMYTHLMCVKCLGSVARRSEWLSGFLQASLIAIIPSLFCCILFGAFPMKINCNFSNFAVWLFLINPIVETIVAFTQITLLIASVDSDLPWRPLRTYLPILLIVYGVQVLFFLPIVLTVGNFAMMGLVSLFVGFITRYICVKKFKCRILGWNETPITDKMAQRYDQFRRYMIAAFCIDICYLLYSVAFKEVNPRGRSALGFMLVVADIVVRKVTQYFTVGLTREMNFVLSGLWVFCNHGLFVAYSSPNIDPRSDDRYDLKAYTALALSVFGSVFGCFLFMSDFWFRFRCWIKKIPRAVVCKPLDFEAIPIEEDMDFDGRGIKNDHPSYMRTKIHYSFYLFMGLQASYSLFLLTTWVLKYGKLSQQFPFSQNYVNVEGHDEFSQREFENSMMFAAASVTFIFVFYAIWKWFLRTFYPELMPYFNSVLRHTRESHMLGFACLVVSANAVRVISYFMFQNRIWYNRLLDILDKKNDFGDLC